MAVTRQFKQELSRTCTAYTCKCFSSTCIKANATLWSCVIWHRKICLKGSQLLPVNLALFSTSFDEINNLTYIHMACTSHVYINSGGNLANTKCNSDISACVFESRTEKYIFYCLCTTGSWTMEDKVVFEQAYHYHGKHFQRIRAMVRPPLLAAGVLTLLLLLQTSHNDISDS